MNFLIKAITAIVPSKKLRKKLRVKLKCKYYTIVASRHLGCIGENSIFTNRAKVSNNVFVGGGSHIDNLTVLGGGKVEIGDHVSIGPNCIIQTQNHNYKGALLPYDFDFICKDVSIGNAVWIGMNVTLLPGAHIGEGAIIQMGSVVHGEIPPLAIAGGNPAKVFAWRDREHYETLKSCGRYIWSSK